jgi:LDH2 family malate/lactate/ureidoglycolate dehydrogenase
MQFAVSGCHRTRANLLRAVCQCRESNQGAFICVFNPKAFMPPDVFASEMDTYLETIAAMQPWPGQEHAELPGGPEARQARQRGREDGGGGIPLARDHVESLTALGELLGVPWDVAASG